MVGPVAPPVAPPGATAVVMTAKIGQGNSTQDDPDGCRMIPGLSARTSVASEVTEVSGICGNYEAPEVSGIDISPRILLPSAEFRFAGFLQTGAAPGQWAGGAAARWEGWTASQAAFGIGWLL